MLPYGTHVLADLWGCNSVDLQDESFLRASVKGAVEAAGATLHQLSAITFPAQPPLNTTGVTVVAILAESHLTLHTYPEAGFAAVDIYMCGTRCVPGRGLDYLRAALKPSLLRVRRVVRGEMTTGDGFRSVSNV